MRNLRRSASIEGPEAVGGRTRRTIPFDDYVAKEKPLTGRSNVEEGLYLVCKMLTEVGRVFGSKRLAGAWSERGNER